MVGGYVVDMQKRSMGQAGITGMDNLVYGERETDAEKGLRRTSAYTAGLKSRLGEQDSNLHRISAANVQMAPAVDTGR